MPGKNSYLLNSDERKTIQDLICKSYTIGKIADLLGRSHSCIKQEILKNGGKSRYSWQEAQRNADIRQEAKKRKLSHNFTVEQIKIINDLVEVDKSQNHIASVLGISHQTLRTYLNRNAISLPKRNYTAFVDRITAIEEQIKLIFEILEGISNAKN